MDDDTNITTPSPIILLSITSPQTIQKCLNFELSDTDIFICSYPKSGTTWMQHILITLIHVNNGNRNTIRLKEEQVLTDVLPPPFYKHVSDYAPFFEIDAHWDDCNIDTSSSSSSSSTKNSTTNVEWICQNQKQISRRIYNTHLPFHMLPKSNGNCGSKFIYIIRAPLDTCISYYEHLSNQVEGGYEKSKDEFFIDWLNGKIAYGKWIDHVVSYVVSMFDNHSTVVATTTTTTTASRHVKFNDGREFLFVFYKDMIEQLSNVVYELVDFLHLKFIEAKDIEQILPHFSFTYMKHYLNYFQPKSVTWKKKKEKETITSTANNEGDNTKAKTTTFQFIRNGRIGDGSKIFTIEQQSMFYKSILNDDTKLIDQLISHLYLLQHQSAPSKTTNKANNDGVFISTLISLITDDQ